MVTLPLPNWIVSLSRTISCARVREIAKRQIRTAISVRFIDSSSVGKRSMVQSPRSGMSDRTYNPQFVDHGPWTMDLGPLLCQLAFIRELAQHALESAHRT